MLIKIVTYGEMMLTLHLLSTFSLLYFRNTVLCRLKLRFQPEIGGNREIQIFYWLKGCLRCLELLLIKIETQSCTYCQHFIT